MFVIAVLLADTIHPPPFRCSICLTLIILFYALVNLYEQIYSLKAGVILSHRYQTHTRVPFNIKPKHALRITVGTVLIMVIEDITGRLLTEELKQLYMTRVDSCLRNFAGQ